MTWFCQTQFAISMPCNNISQMPFAQEEYTASLNGVILYLFIANRLFQFLQKKSYCYKESSSKKKFLQCKQKDLKTFHFLAFAAHSKYPQTNSIISTIPCKLEVSKKRKLRNQLRSFVQTILMIATTNGRKKQVDWAQP